MALDVESNMMNLFENLSSKVPFWDVKLPESPWDFTEDSKDLDVLCELVRNQYLKRLRQTLLDNLKVSEGYQKGNLTQAQQYVDICMTEMEKQALRKCMVARLYREGMSNMINEVKTCTKNSMLCVWLKHIIESNNQSSVCDKYFGSENITKNSICITEEKKKNLASVQIKKITDAVNNFFIHNNNLNPVGSLKVLSSSYDLQQINTEPKIENVASVQTAYITDADNNLVINNNNTNPGCILNVSPNSYDVQPKISESNIFDNLNSLLKSSSCSSNSSPNASMEVNYKFDFTESASLHKNTDSQNCETDKMLSINSLLKDLQDSPEYEQQSLKLEGRLITLGLATENHKSIKQFPESTKPNYISPNTIRLKKINEILKDKLKSERVAKTYELRKSMNEMPQELQIRLNQKFCDLFGNNHSYESDSLSEEEERIIAHKRIVKMVVEIMTPYYKAHRINRHLFKSLAKLISKNLMDRAYDPDEEIVAKRVNEFFTGNRCIKTAEDIYQ